MCIEVRKRKKWSKGENFIIVFKILKREKWIIKKYDEKMKSIKGTIHINHGPSHVVWKLRFTMYTQRFYNEETMKEIVRIQHVLWQSAIYSSMLLRMRFKGTGFNQICLSLN